jgi:hypothetical protein
VESYSQALDKIKENAVPDEIEFELISEKRILLPAVRITRSADFATFRSHETLKKVAGVFIFGFVQKSLQKGKKHMIVGVCEMHLNGSADAKFGNINKNVTSRVNNQVFYHEDYIRVSTSYDDGLDPIKYDFNLKIIDRTVNAKVLGGPYNGVDIDGPRSGDVFFIQTHESYESLDNLLNSISLDEAVNHERKEIQRIAKYLTNRDSSFLITGY